MALPLLLFTFFRPNFLLCLVLLIYLQVVPWAAAVSDKVQDMRTQMAEVE